MSLEPVVIIAPLILTSLMWMKVLFLILIPVEDISFGAAGAYTELWKKCSSWGQARQNSKVLSNLTG